ncbi:MAG: zinc ABC transporter substrate-binding protein [Lachnospiraceae bacterium]|nr:zinc ABC transporter substrate-binding protein [Lachnospiraceae bacterium]
MKKFIYMFGTFVLGAALYSGCGFQTTPIEKGADKVSVVCTTFPQYDWVMNLLGDAAEEFEVSLLVKNSADIHNYQPSAQDMIAMKEADLFLYVGGESDAWVEDIMKADGTLSDKSVSLVAALGDKSLVEEIVEGMEHDHEHGHGHEKDHEHADEVLDEHVWLSLENAEILCQYISGRLQELAPDEAVVIAENTATYVKELHELGVEYQEVVDESAHNALIFGDRFPFRYLTEDYDLEYYAAFAGCNAEVEAGFDTIIGLAGKVDELKVPCVLVIDGSDKSLAEAILQAAGDKDKEILTLDSMQSVSWEDILRGANYLDIMKANLEVLCKALG